MKTTIILGLFFLSNVAIAGPNHEHPTPKLSAAFEGLKAVVGTWEGKANMNGKEEDMKVTYQLTSGGTAIVETLNPGTPMEMVTVYANRGNDVRATHFCMLGNQPEMKLKKSSANQFAFEMDGTKGLSNKKEMHMHGVTLSIDKDKLKHEWTNYKDGKKGEMVVFEFKKTN